MCGDELFSCASMTHIATHSYTHTVTCCTRHSVCTCSSITCRYCLHICVYIQKLLAPTLSLSIHLCSALSCPVSLSFSFFFFRSQKYHHVSLLLSPLLFLPSRQLANCLLLCVKPCQQGHRSHSTFKVAYLISNSHMSPVSMPTFFGLVSGECVPLGLDLSRSTLPLLRKE